MTTIQVAKPFKLLLAPNEKPVEFGVGEHEVSDEVANHWHVQPHLEGYEPPAPPEPETPVITSLDPETATRDELLAFIRGGFDAYLAGLSDDELRESAAYQIRRDAEACALAADDDDAPEGGEGTDESATGGAGDDTLMGGAGPDSLTADESDASTGGAAGDDSISGGQGADVISGEGSQAGEAGSDSITGGAAPDAIEAEAKKPGRGKPKAEPEA